MFIEITVSRLLFHTNNVENITLAEQKKKNVSEELTVTELTVKSY